jgi:hypothetical protein
MTASEFDWSGAPLSSDDEALIDAYKAVGVPVDALPYTPEFDKLIERLGLPVAPPSQRSIYRRLLTLRKRALLPRVYTTAGAPED